MKAKRQKLRRL